MPQINISFTSSRGAAAPHNSLTYLQVRGGGARLGWAAEHSCWRMPLGSTHDKHPHAPLPRGCITSSPSHNLT